MRSRKSSQVGDTLINSTDQARATTITVADTLGQTNSVGLGFAAGWELFTALNQFFDRAHGRPWRASYTFTKPVRVQCPPHTACRVIASEPMFMDKGEVNITRGDITWRVRNVSFVSPDPTGTPAYRVAQTPIKQLTVGPGQWAPPSVLSGSLARAGRSASALASPPRMLSARALARARPSLEVRTTQDERFATVT